MFLGPFTLALENDPTNIVPERKIVDFSYSPAVLGGLDQGVPYVSKHYPEAMGIIDIRLYMCLYMCVLFSVPWLLNPALHVISLCDSVPIPRYGCPLRSLHVRVGSRPPLRLRLRVRTCLPVYRRPPRWGCLPWKWLRVRRIILTRQHLRSRIFRYITRSARASLSPSHAVLSAFFPRTCADNLFVFIILICDVRFQLLEGPPLLTPCVLPVHTWQVAFPILGGIAFLQLLQLWNACTAAASLPAPGGSLPWLLILLILSRTPFRTLVTLSIK